MGTYCPTFAMLTQAINIIMIILCAHSHAHMHVQTRTHAVPVMEHVNKTVCDEKQWASITGYLHKLDRSQIVELGGELGLSIFRLEKMQNLPGDMVKAWLIKQDNVKEKCGDPLTWEALVKVLHKIEQRGIADDILRDKHKWSGSDQGAV